MKKITLLLFVFIVTLTSCIEKQYKYIEVQNEVGVLGTTSRTEKDAVIINAASDSAAYLEAYQKFCISKKVSKDMEESIGRTFTTPIEFKLLNDKGEDITYSVTFATKDKEEKKIDGIVNSSTNSIKESLEESKKQEAAELKKTIKIDSAKIKELKKFFYVKSDEFSNNNLKWHKVKSAPRYTNANGIYIYFQTENGIPSNLRFRLQYYSDDWLFIKYAQFSIDGKAFEFYPNNVETDNGDGGYIWEWWDESLTSSEHDLIYALAYSKKAKVKLIGRQYYDIKNISQEQILGIKRTLDYYAALGGKY